MSNRKTTISAAALALALAISAPSLPARADVANGDWFVHEFGELRSYHGSWLAVCESSGAGDCRAVQYLFGKSKDRFFGDSRLSIGPLAAEDGDSTVIELYDRGAPDRPLGPVTFEIGRRSWVLQPGRTVTEARTGAGGTISESYQIVDPDLVSDILASMRSGRRLRIGYQTDDGRKHLVFSLSGFSTTTRAIETRR